MIIAVLFVSVVFSQTVAPGWESRKDKAVQVWKYEDDYLRNPAQGGTCNYGNIYGLQGNLIAANTPLYSGDYSYKRYDHDGQNGTPKTKSDGCGVCYAIVGPGGSFIGINADICDGCMQYPGVGPTFNMYDNKLSDIMLFDKVVGRPGVGTLSDPTGITIQKISCPLSIFKGNGVSISWNLWWKRAAPTFLGSFEFTILNHRTPIKDVRVSVGGGAFKSLTRGWTNKWGDTPIFDASKSYKFEIESESGILSTEITANDLKDQKSGVLVSSLSDSQMAFPYQGVILRPSSFQFPDYSGGNQPTSASRQPTAAPVTTTSKSATTTSKSTTITTKSSTSTSKTTVASLTTNPSSQTADAQSTPLVTNAPTDATTTIANTNDPNESTTTLTPVVNESTQQSSTVEKQCDSATVEDECGKRCQSRANVKTCHCDKGVFSFECKEMGTDSTLTLQSVVDDTQASSASTIAMCWNALSLLLIVAVVTLI